MPGASETMAKEVRIPWPKGLVTHRGVCTEIVLREPTYDEYLDLGEIVTYGKAPDGTIFPVENSEVLRSYIARCIVEPKDPLALTQGGVKLGRAVKGAVEGFFRDEPSVTEPLPISQTTSSSNASQDGSPQTA
ncbi:hypothetical protein [Beijerinckia sp. L45]|uniref:hypothetical protein n=1 Tax=Beijerinckia sp. L45 TaxID=1641855 RepID=UPI00131B4263|nr:hypothetical protein [Beijerinckia sp. L45]